MLMWKNTFINLLGIGIPVLFAFPAMAYIARVLDIEEFGIFMLSFSIVGYAGIFDGGLSRAVIRKVAIYDHDLDSIGKVIGTSVIAVFVLSLVAWFCIYTLSPTIVNLLNISEQYEVEAEKAFKIVAFIIPFFLVGLVCFAYLEGRQSFILLNKYKAISGLMLAIAPVLSLLLQANIIYALYGLLIARIISCFLAIYTCYSPLGNKMLSFDFSVLHDLVKFSSWITVSNIISPLMVYSDKFILSSLLGADKVGFYAGPSELISKMSILPGALARTLFPLFSLMGKEASESESSAYKGLIVILLVVVLPVFCFSPFILNIWLGKDFSENGNLILKVLVFGFFFNSLALIPYARIQAYGLSRLTAFIHLSEIIPYFILLYFLIANYGLIGAAIAWTVRVLIDFFILECVSRRISNSQS